MLDSLTPDQRGLLLTWALAASAAVFAILTVFVIKWGNKIAQRAADLLGWKLTAEQTKQIDGVLTWAMSLAQEKWTQYLQGKIRTGPSNGADKLALAEQLARDKAPELFAKISTDEFAQLAESKMPSLRPIFAASDPRATSMRPSIVSIPPSDGSSLPPLSMPKLDPLPGASATKVAK